jgi:putative DNA primase/helicase
MNRFVEETVERPAKPAAKGNKSLDDVSLEILADFEACGLTAEELRGKKIPKRPKLLGEWLCQGDLGFIFAPRGLGKTWLAKALTKTLAKGNGQELACWKAGEPQTVLVVDGEMNLDQTTSREQALQIDPEGRWHILHHDILFLEKGRSLNLTDIATQKALTMYAEKLSAKVLALDNLSSLFYGMKENEADGWEMVLPWLLELRRKGITVIIVHHSGTDGQRMRGTTKREDHAHWVIRLEPSKEGEPEEGARFRLNFTKCRNCPFKEVPPVEIHFKPAGLKVGMVEMSWKVMDNLEVLKMLMADYKEARCSELAEDMGLTKGAVSKLANKGEKEGWLTISGRDYVWREPPEDVFADGSGSKYQAR